MQFRQIDLLRRFTDGLRYNDMMQSLHPPFKDKVTVEWAKELAESLKDFRNRLLAEEIKHQYYENLLNKVDTAVLVANKEGHIRWMNRSAIVHLGQISQLPEAILAVSTATNQITVVRIEQNNTILEMAVSSTRFTVHGKEEQIISLKNIHSVLEQNEMEAWQKLIRVLTHEIMNSITPIISLSETLSDRTNPQPNEKEYAIMLQAMQTIHRRSKGLLDFVENYRRLTRIPTPVRTEIAVAELFTDLKNLFPEEYIHFEQTDPRLSLYADRTLIEQVLINLLQNACEACGKQAEKNIRVKAQRMPDNTRTLSVSDNGKGILPDVMDKIFVPFYTTKTTGSGIGLSLCKQIMSLHKGNIHVKSEPGTGSCFVLTFLN